MPFFDFVIDTHELISTEMLFCRHKMCYREYVKNVLLFFYKIFELYCLLNIILMKF